jgi:hypothetical protein
MATTIPGKATGIPGMATTIPARHPKVVAFRLESVVAFDRNRWSPSIGIGGRLRLEWVVAFDRNMHSGGSIVAAALADRADSLATAAWSSTALLEQVDGPFRHVVTTKNLRNRVAGTSPWSASERAACRLRLRAGRGAR